MEVKPKVKARVSLQRSMNEQKLMKNNRTSDLNNNNNNNINNNNNNISERSTVDNVFELDSRCSSDSVRDNLDSVHDLNSDVIHSATEPDENEVTSNNKIELIKIEKDLCDDSIRIHSGAHSRNYAEYENYNSADDDDDRLNLVEGCHNDDGQDGYTNNEVNIRDEHYSHENRLLSKLSQLSAEFSKPDSVGLLLVSQLLSNFPPLHYDYDSDVSSSADSRAKKPSPPGLSTSDNNKFNNLVGKKSEKSKSDICNGISKLRNTAFNNLHDGTFNLGHVLNAGIQNCNEDGNAGMDDKGDVINAIQIGYNVGDCYNINEVDGGDIKNSDSEIFVMSPHLKLNAKYAFNLQQPNIKPSSKEGHRRSRSQMDTKANNFLTRIKSHQSDQNRKSKLNSHYDRQRLLSSFNIGQQKRSRQQLCQSPFQQIFDGSMLIGRWKLDRIYSVLMESKDTLAKLLETKKLVEELKVQSSRQQRLFTSRLQLLQKQIQQQQQEIKLTKLGENKRLKVLQEQLFELKSHLKNVQAQQDQIEKQKMEQQILEQQQHIEHDQQIEMLTFLNEKFQNNVDMGNERVKEVIEHILKEKEIDFVGLKEQNLIYSQQLQHQLQQQEMLLKLLHQQTKLQKQEFNKKYQHLETKVKNQIVNRKEFALDEKLQDLTKQQKPQHPCKFLQRKSSPLTKQEHKQHLKKGKQQLIRVRQLKQHKVLRYPNQVTNFDAKNNAEQSNETFLETTEQESNIGCLALQQKKTNCDLETMPQQRKKLSRQKISSDKVKNEEQQYKHQQLLSEFRWHSVQQQSQQFNDSKKQKSLSIPTKFCKQKLNSKEVRQHHHQIKDICPKNSNNLLLDQQNNQSKKKSKIIEEMQKDLEGDTKEKLNSRVSIEKNSPQPLSAITETTTRITTNSSRNENIADERFSEDLKMLVDRTSASDCRRHWDEMEEENEGNHNSSRENYLKNYEDEEDGDNFVDINKKSKENNYNKRNEKKFDINSDACNFNNVNDEHDDINCLTWEQNLANDVILNELVDESKQRATVSMYGSGGDGDDDDFKNSKNRDECRIIKRILNSPYVLDINNTLHVDCFENEKISQLADAEFNNFNMVLQKNYVQEGNKVGEDKSYVDGVAIDNDDYDCRSLKSEKGNKPNKIDEKMKTSKRQPQDERKEPSLNHDLQQQQFSQRFQRRRINSDLSNEINSKLSIQEQLREQHELLQKQQSLLIKIKNEQEKYYRLKNKRDNIQSHSQGEQRQETEKFKNFPTTNNTLLVNNEDFSFDNIHDIPTTAAANFKKMSEKTNGTLLATINTTESDKFSKPSEYRRVRFNKTIASTNISTASNFKPTHIVSESPHFNSKKKSYKSMKLANSNLDKASMYLHEIISNEEIAHLKVPDSEPELECDTAFKNVLKNSTNNDFNNDDLPKNVEQPEKKKLEGDFHQQYVIELIQQNSPTSSTLSSPNYNNICGNDQQEKLEQLRNIKNKNYNTNFSKIPMRQNILTKQSSQQTFSPSPFSIDPNSFINQAYCDSSSTKNIYNKKGKGEESNFEMITDDSTSVSSQSIHLQQLNSSDESFDLKFLDDCYDPTHYATSCSEEETSINDVQTYVSCTKNVCASGERCEGSNIATGNRSYRNKYKNNSSTVPIDYATDNENNCDRYNDGFAKKDFLDKFNCDNVNKKLEKSEKITGRYIVDKHSSKSHNELIKVYTEKYKDDLIDQIDEIMGFGVGRKSQHKLLKESADLLNNSSQEMVKQIPLRKPSNNAFEESVLTHKNKESPFFLVEDKRMSNHAEMYVDRVCAHGQSIVQAIECELNFVKPYLTNTENSTTTKLARREITKITQFLQAEK
ncbi:hypothetical protein HELRODRAFT_165928 [Helobdella robusta]|uniref:Uncharacterized protein n=1 Tax=Helobdella robusta TaxID=6412 RepID=T1EXG9_HELRO|nr:hypothetical protein HELRODRAFT_165928 [Helobdella robusta]ESN90284.1 hypothetical protein HELRODRAFT_165928 [Helobdella robusta]